jgi:uncharacterized membrane protein
MKTFKIVSLAVFSALIFVVTAYLFIPVGIGNINFGDAFILLAAVLLGPVYGAICGALGATLADLVSGYVVYAPFTFVIKAVEGLLCGILLHKALKKQKLPVWQMILTFVVSVLTMVLGYFVANTTLYSVETAISIGLPNDLVQAGVSVVAALALTVALKKIPYINKLFLSDTSAKSISEKSNLND